MSEASLRNVCRICPNAGQDDRLLNIFDERLSLTDNMKEVVAVTTGVEILKSDLVSTKICQKCHAITLKMFQFRQDALKQDRVLKGMFSNYLENQGIKLPNACVAGKKEKSESRSLPLSAESKLNQGEPYTNKKGSEIRLHPTVVDIYKKYPNLKLPKKCLGMHLTPIVSLSMGYVESYIKNINLGTKQFISKSGTKEQASKTRSKKISCFPKKHKTVPPLKISKLENSEQPGDMNNNYVCTLLSKKRRERKRKVSLTVGDNGTGPKLKSTDNNNKFGYQLASESFPDTLEPEVSNAVKLSVVHDDTAVASILPQHQINSCSDHHIENGSKINPTDNTNKTEFIESLGLIPRIVTTKSHTLLTCNVCGSIHDNAGQLKLHKKIHMVCQFCKRKFRSIEAKTNHVDKLCDFKKIMDSPGPIVALEKMHRNKNIRKKYIKTFSKFDLNSDLVGPPLKHVRFEAVPSPSVVEDDVIFISDVEKSSANCSDPISDIEEEIPSSSAAVGEVRPTIKIKNNTVLNHFTAKTSDKELIEDLIGLISSRSDQPETCDQTLQTDLLPDIKINNVEGTCEFKRLNEQLKSDNIPVKISNGSFNVSFIFDNDSQPNTTLASWNDLQIIDQYNTPKPTNTPSKSKRFSYQNKSKVSLCPKPTVVREAQVNLLSVASTSISVATPLQDNALNKTPPLIANKFMPSPRKHADLSLNKNIGVLNSNQVASSASVGMNIVTGNVLHGSITNSKTRKANTSLAKKSVSVLNTIRSKATSPSTLSNSKEFRVKEVWELQ